MWKELSIIFKRIKVTLNTKLLISWTNMEKCLVMRVIFLSGKVDQTFKIPQFYELQIS